MPEMQSFLVPRMLYCYIRSIPLLQAWYTTASLMTCPLTMYVSYINEATNFAESQGCGGIKEWGRDKDEDDREWIRRCLRQAAKMVKPIIKGD